MENIKTVADFKRALTIGKELTMIHHMKLSGYDENKKPIFSDADPVKRIVKRVLSTQVVFETPEGKESWADFPKASKVILDGNRVTYLEPDTRQFKGGHLNSEAESKLPLIPMLTYIFN